MVFISFVGKRVQHMPLYLAASNFERERRNRQSSLNIGDEIVQNEHLNHEHLNNEHLNNEHLKSEHTKSEHMKNEHSQNENMKNEHIKHEHMKPQVKNIYVANDQNFHPNPNNLQEIFYNIDRVEVVPSKLK